MLLAVIVRDPQRDNIGSVVIDIRANERRPRNRRRDPGLLETAVVVQIPLILHDAAVGIAAAAAVDRQRLSFGDGLITPGLGDRVDIRTGCGGSFEQGQGVDFFCQRIERDVGAVKQHRSVRHAGPDERRSADVEREYIVHIDGEVVVADRFAAVNRQQQRSGIEQHVADAGRFRDKFEADDRVRDAHAGVITIEEFPSLVR